jgi:hypothetical protein
MAPRLTVVVVLLLAAAGCNNRAPNTRVMVYNRGMAGIEVGGRHVDSSHSIPVYVTHGATDSFELRRSALELGTLVVFSLLPEADGEYYEAAVNLYEDSVGVFRMVEFSPYIDAEILRP